MIIYLIVGTKVPKRDHKSFDCWRQIDHLPAAKNAFKATGSERGRSANDPCLHFAIYRFDDLETANPVSRSDEPKDLIIEFDRVSMPPRPLNFKASYFTPSPSA